MKTINISACAPGVYEDEADGSDVICINPYHYVITPEAEARLEAGSKN
jgi:hypothetical protein